MKLQLIIHLLRKTSDKNYYFLICFKLQIFDNENIYSPDYTIITDMSIYNTVQEISCKNWR